jgi:hypothetical protein
MHMRVLIFLGVMLTLAACQREATDPTNPGPLVTSAPAPAPSAEVAPPKDLNNLARPAEQAGLTPIDKRSSMAPEDKIRGGEVTRQDANQMVREEKMKALRSADRSPVPAAPAAGSAPDKNQMAPPEMAAEKAVEPVLSVQKMPCFGDCERYTISLFPDGRMVLDAKKGLDRVGNYERTLFTTETRDLLRNLAELERMDFSATYPEEEVVDVPATVVTLRDEEGNFRKVTVYGDAPEKLAELITQLEAMARGGFWQKTMR